MSGIDYIGLDVHKKTVAYCVKTADGRIKDEGSVAATRQALTDWADGLDGPWLGAMEATLFTGWIYDHLQPHAVDLKVAHSLMLRAIVVSKKKNDRIDARKIADLLRCDLLPECYIAPPQIRELRRALRFRNLLMRQTVRMKNRISGFLMEVGGEYTKSKLHGKRYFAELLESLDDVPESVVELLQMSRGALEMLQSMQRELIDGLREHPVLERRVDRLMTIPGVGIVTALTWALEVGDPERLPSVGRAISYCGLCSAQNSSAGKERRGPISKQRNSHLQRVLIEAAKLAPRYNPQLAVVHERELARGNRNRATIAVARKMVAYLLAVDKRQTAFEPTMAPSIAA
jgi:transposase